MTIVRLNNRDDLESVERLADEIWHEHFTPIIGKAQVVYMLETFQSQVAMDRQIDEGYVYYLLRETDAFIGYMSVCFEADRLFLSKFYLKASHRGRGYARIAVDFLVDLAKEEGMSKIALTVNRDNRLAIDAYERLGFMNMGTIVQDIGSGFVMDDYKMQREIID